VQGFRSLINIVRVFRMLARGKINPYRTAFKIKTAAADAARRILGERIS
jgi:hypothetical protein